MSAADAAEYNESLAAPPEGVDHDADPSSHRGGSPAVRLKRRPAMRIAIDDARRASRWALGVTTGFTEVDNTVARLIGPAALKYPLLSEN